MSTPSRPEILALIPARGGSKSIPRKNLLPLAGKPLIAHSIGQARASGHITRTVVSTDDEEIARVAQQYGAEVPFLRPAEFAQDQSTDLEVFQHALHWLAANEGYRPELVVHLRATGPVRRVALIDQAIELLLRHPEADALRSVSLPAQTPYKMWRIRGEYLEPLLSVEGVAESYCQPRQSLPDVYWQNGYVDIIRPAATIEQGLMAGRTLLPFLVNDPIYEIDYVEHLPAVEAALLALQRGELATLPAEKRYPV